MKTLITDYAFNKTTKQVIFLGRDYPKSLEEVLLITNVTTGDIIYNFADKLRGGSIDSNVLTLIFDTTKMSDTDNLQIFIESNVYQEDVIKMMTTILKTVNFARDPADRMRMVMDNNPMLYTYMRNSGTAMAASTETWYSVGSWNTVDARDQLMSINNTNMMNRIGRWVR